MLVADTSAWIEYLRRTESPADLALNGALGDGQVILLEPVRAELLTGARSAVELAELRRMLEGFDVALVQPRDDFDSACELYHRCRAVGITPRGLIDCLIAAMALRAGHPLLHADRDLAAIAAVAGISPAPGSLAA